MTSHDTALPVTTLLPETATDPVTLFDQHAALRFAIVERDLDAVLMTGPLFDNAYAYVSENY